MQLPPSENATSSVEDLDPEPLRREGLGQKRELILGLVLLCVVLGWAGWQWWSQARNESEYAQGEQALAAGKLDEAEAHFAAIPGYKDAGSLAHDITLKTSERDDQYRQALAAIDVGDWITAYNSARQVISIEPGYLDTGARLDQARKHIYTQAYSGTVVVRADADPPGLYFRQGDRWIWLQGSDAASQVRGTGPPGHLVYDVPPQGRQRAASESGQLEGSALMLATIAPGGLTFQPLSLDPSIYDFYIWGERGIWGLASQIDDQSRPDYVFRPNFGGYDLTYESYAGTAISPMVPKDSNWFILDLAPDGEHILLANIGDYSNNNPVTQLYTADGNGTNLRFLYSYVGRMYRALFSPDSKHVLVSTFSHVGFSPVIETQELVLLDATGRDQPRVLAHSDVRVNETNYNRAVFSSSFVQSGKYRGDALVVQWGESTTSISLLDPGRPATGVLHRWTVPGDAWPTLDTWAGQVENSQGLLLVFQRTPANGDPYLNVVWDTGSFDPNADSSGPSLLFNWTSINLAPGEKLQRAWLRDGYLLYVTSQQPDASPTSMRFVLYSRKLPIFAEPRGEPPVRITTTVQLIDNLTDGGLNFGAISQQLDLLAGSKSLALGPDLLARGRGQLQVETYDGASTANMGVVGYTFYDWTQYEAFRDLR